MARAVHFHLLSHSNQTNLPFLKPKGLLQVLWERGWINKARLSNYTNDGREDQKEDGVLKAEHEQFSLRHLMRSCPDFQDELSAMEHLAQVLSSPTAAIHMVLLSTKYHCEIAGEGAEYIGLL